MCKYCEKGQRIRTKDKGVNSATYIHWEDCEPSLHTKVADVWVESSIYIKIFYCPWCGKDLTSD